MTKVKLNKAATRYVDDVVEMIEETVILGSPDHLRLRSDLEAEISQRLGESPTSEQIERELGCVADWAKNFVDASDLPKATYSSNYVQRKSKTKLFGVPLVHVAFGSKNNRIQTARGIIAIGNTAFGVIALGGMARGIIAIGGFSMGLISFGGFSLGLLLALGGFALAPFAFGGFAIGVLSVGGFALGYYATGGFAAGHTAIGGMVYAIEGLGGEIHVQSVLDKSHWLNRFIEYQTHSSFYTVVNFFVVLFVVMLLAVQGIAYFWAKKKPC